MEDSLERVYFLSGISLGSRYFFGEKMISVFNFLFSLRGKTALLSL